jgi:hypothetical protein
MGINRNLHVVSSSPVERDETINNKLQGYYGHT